MMLNADASRGPSCAEVATGLRGVRLVELEDEHGQVIPGYDRASFNPIMDQDGVDFALRWNNATLLSVGRQCDSEDLVQGVGVRGVRGPVLRPGF